LLKYLYKSLIILISAKFNKKMKKKNQFPLMRNNILRGDLNKVIQYLRRDDPILTNGQKVREFEEKWSKWLGVKYSVFVNSGSSANLLSMAILKTQFPDGGEIIVPPLTWVSDISSVIQNGFKPVFVDINPSTLAIDSKKTILKLNKKTRCIFLTHVQGFNGLTDELLHEASKKNIPIIEDVCESHGAKHNNKKLGSFGWISNFSFYYAHHMTTIEGGMFCTNDKIAYQKARLIRSHGMVRESNDEKFKNEYFKKYPNLNPDFIFAFPSYNLRNTEIAAIIGLNQLKRLDKNVKKRTENLKYFLKKIDPKIYYTDFDLKGSSNYAFNLILKKPNKLFVKKLINEMKENGIEFRRGSAGGGNQLRQPYLEKIIPKNFYKKFPKVEPIHFYGFYIGNFPDIKKNEIDNICSVLNNIK
jgi:CDP-6-deoxy-D-xylo-4-hexulose-3-dehydrase